MKKLAFALILIFAMLLTLNCYAAPASVNASDGGNIKGLMVVKKPESAISSTTKRTYTISAVSIEGIEISIYGYNNNTGLFDIIRDSYGNALTSRVGATGLYVRDIELLEGTNYLLIRAQYGDSLYQDIRFDITLMKQESLDSIKGYASSFNSMFGGW